MNFVDTYILSEIIYFNLLWSRADSLSSFVSHSCRKTGLSHSHPMYQKSCGVVIKSFAEGAAAKKHIKIIP